MRVAFTSDLHIDITAQNRKLLPYLAEEIERLSPDALVLAGDIANTLSGWDVALQAFQPTAVGPHGIEVNVLFSDQAKGKLLRSKETIIAACYLTGVPRKGTLKECNDQIRVEIAPGEVARFRDVDLPKGC